MVDAWRLSKTFARVVETVVRQADYQQVLPLGKLFHPVDELAQTIVCKGESVRYVLVQAVVRYLKRLVAAQGQESCVPRTIFPFFQNIIQKIEGDIIIYSPGILFL